MSLSSLGLDAFFAVCKWGTVIEASKNIHLTQTAVTQRLRALEIEVGATLFIRTRKGMKLTPEGQTLYRYCLQRDEMESKTLEDLKLNHQGSHVQISVSGPTYLLEDRIVPKLQMINFKIPRLTLHLEIDHSRDLVTKILRAEIDLAIVPKEHCGIDLELKELKPTQYFLVASSTWQGRKLDDIFETEREVVYSSGDRFIDLFLQHINKKNIDRRRERIFVNNEHLVSQVVQSGLGYMMLDSRIATPLLKSGKLINLLPKKNIEIPWILIWARRTIMPQCLQHIIDFVD